MAPGQTRHPTKRPRVIDSDDNKTVQENFYKPYIKPGYKRVFPEQPNTNSDFTVFVEHSNKVKIGNKNPLTLANLFKNDIKGIVNIKRINAEKIGVTFSQANNANNFLTNDQFLTKHNFKAYIPARAVETIGVLRYVPLDIDNEELFKKLTSEQEIISVRRFTKKVDGQIKPFTSVSITFVGKTLPETVHLDIFRFKVHAYIAPLLQCYKCFKFNHGAKICKSTQRCSLCTGEHHYKECDTNTIKCINCSGAHLAISRECPIKQLKIQERNNKTTYANALNSTSPNLLRNYNHDFPALTPPINKPKQYMTEKTLPSKVTEKELIDEIIKNDNIIKGIVSALVALGNENKKVTVGLIKETLVKKLKHG